MRNFLYVIRTTDNRRLEVEAPDGQTALRLASIPPEQCRAWYPFPIAALPTPEEEEAKAERLNKLREKRAEIKTVCGKRKEKKNMDTIDKLGTLRAEKIKAHLRQIEQLQVADMPAREVPTGALQPKKKQTDKPMELETVYIEASQGRLF